MEDQEKFREHFMQALGAADPSDNARLQAEILKIVENAETVIPSMIGQVQSRDRTARAQNKEAGIRYDGYHNIDKIVPNFNTMVRASGLLNEV